MVYELLITLHTGICMLLILIVLIQKGKGGMGIGSIGGSSQLLFGGSGGQDIFQKITWVLAALFMSGSLFLALMKSYQTQNFKFTQKREALRTEAISGQQEAADQKAE